MQRPGLSAHRGAGRDGLKELHDGSSSRPALPQAGELMDMLVVPALRVGQLAELLFGAAVPMVMAGPVAPAARSAPPEPEALQASAASVRPAWSLLRLPSAARLRSALPRPALAENRCAPREALAGS